MVKTRDRVVEDGAARTAASSTVEASLHQRAAAPPNASDTESEMARQTGQEVSPAPMPPAPAPAPFVPAPAPLAPAPPSPSPTPSQHSQQAQQTNDRDDNTLIKDGSNTKKKALAQARLALAEARLAVLEAELLSDDDLDSTVISHYPTSPVISGNAAGIAAQMKPPLDSYTVASRTNATTEARRECLTPRAAVGSPVTLGTAAGNAADRSPQLMETSSTRREASISDVAVNAAPCTAPPPSTPRQSDDAGQSLRDLATALLEVARGGRPAANRYYFELPNFNGAVSEWLHFKAAYEESASAYSVTENLARLRKSLKGIAMEAVKSLFLGSSPDVIITKLECRFGRPNALIIHELDKLRHLPKLTDNPRDVCIFASKVGNIIATVQALQKPEYLHSPEMVNIVTDKLTTVIRNRWYDFEMKAGDTAPGLVILGQFLDGESELNARHARAEVIEEPHRRGFNEKPFRTFNARDSNRDVTTCRICDGTCSNAAVCSKFKNMSVPERWDISRLNKLCFRCLQKRSWKHRCRSKQCEVDGCEYYHHRLLHGSSSGMRMRAEGGTHTLTEATDDYTAIDTSGSRLPQQGTMPLQNPPPCCHRDTSIVTTMREPRANTHTLLKVIPVIISGPQGEMNTFALLDDGSTVTLITTEISQRIGAHGPNEPFYIEAVAGAHIDANNSQRVEFTIRGRYMSEGFKVKARTIDRLDISAQSVPMEMLAGCNHLTSISKQLLYDTGVPSILVGQDNWALLLASEVLQGTRNQPVASRTPLGWVLHGQSCYQAHNPSVHTLRERCSHVSIDKLDQIIQEHFRLESLGVEPRRPRADPETLALQILQRTTRALPEGGYETGMLWKVEGKPFPNNYAAALSRLEGVERRLRKDPNLKQKYSQQIKSMVGNGYAELAPAPPPSDRTWYLPHFPVLNPSKPDKVRVVHDAAARTYGVCLNDYLLTGPDLLESLLGVLMRFRQKPVAVVADIKDMFLRITVREEDRDALRFLWREDSHFTPTEYRMRSVLFGATSSPSTAIYIKNHNARVHESEYPAAVDSIIRHHYMDDFLQSFNDAEEANRVAHAVDAVHQRGNFILQKWTSNDRAAVAGLATEPAALNVCLSNEEKVLGLVWRPADDTLGFNLRKVDPFYLNKQITKRQLLKSAMSLYDPLGLITPITLQAKRILQSTWHTNVGWDEYLPKNLENKWQEWLITLENLKGVQIPRCHEGYSSAIKLDLHVFVDASEHCYAAAAYWRSVDVTGNVRVSLAAAKGRVAPLSITSVPRLELQAAVLGGRLARTVENEHDRRPEHRVFWSDSRTVLAWLRASARSFKPFVAHRVAELEETTAGAEWRWVPTALNVADDATRDVPPDFATTHRWFCGPPFLYDDEGTWPREHEPLTSTDTGEERVTTATATRGPRLIEGLPVATRFSSWLRLIRTTARVLQFIDRCRAHHTTTATRKRTRRTIQDDPTWSAMPPNTTRTPRRASTHAGPSNVPKVYVPLAAQYTRRAEHLWTRALQQECFTVELRDVTGGSAVSTSSRLHRLSLIVDEHGILRVRSRIAAATDVTEETLSPAVLNGDHYYSRLYIDWIHRRLHHSGVECVVNEIRQRYWILRLRPTVQGVIKRCQPCRLRRAVPPEPPTGDLPSCRLAHHRRAFTYAGVDYFGPLSVTVARHHEKRYVALFTCLTTRAVHLEVAASLSTDAAVLALRRMMARRGCPEAIWSDNGTNFHGADAELRKAALASLEQEAEIRHINWYYICPSAPFMGGAWERLVRSVKSALTATLRERHPHEDVLHTLLTEIEHTINSRPLSHVSVAPEDEEALTPNHFLLGGPTKIPLPGSFTKVDELGRSHWRASQRLADIFWQRWVREVLPVLQYRREPHGRGEAIKEGDLVVIVDSNLPRNVWPKGRVERVYPGADGVVRVADVKTKNGVLRRPTKRLVILPVKPIVS